MGKALYRKYRSRSLAEVIGQEHITHTLETALKNGRVSHAYLFTGPRGVGKTSVARILAHEINKLPYEDDSIHMDIIEIDAASNRRIDEIRELRDKVNVAPTTAPYKVYIIDEVHMLTKEAFNALLKTLEEPPKHVIFILATTEAHKLPDTIVSRTQRFMFKPVEQGKVAEHLRTIADREGIKITDEALALIAEHGEGGLRDSISLLDQASGHGGEIDLSYIQSLIGMPPITVMSTLVEGLETHNVKQVIETLAQLYEQGYEPAQIAKQLGEAWRAKMLENNHTTTEDFTLLQRLLKVPSEHNPERYLEIILLEFAFAPSSTPHIQPQEPLRPKPVKSPMQITKPAAVETQPNKITENAKTEPVAKKVSSTNPVLDEKTWQQVLTELKKKHNTLYGLARMAQPNFQDNVLELGFGFAFHRKRLSESKNQQIITDIIQKLTGQAVSIKCLEGTIDSKVVPTIKKPEPVEITPSDKPIDKESTKPDISTISNIFGGGELLES